MSYFDNDCREMLDVYLLETGQLIEKLDSILVESEKSKSLSKEDINSIFRIMHTMKSSAAMMGLTGLSAINHRLEDLFSELRDKPDSQSGSIDRLFDLLFSVSDFIRGETLLMKQENYEPADVTAITGQIEAYLSERAIEEDQEIKKSEETAGEEQSGVNSVTIKVVFEPGCKMENIRALMLMRRVRNICPQAGCTPSSLEENPRAEAEIRENGFLIRIPVDNSDEVCQALRQGMFIKSFEVMLEEHKLKLQEELQDVGEMQPHIEEEQRCSKAETSDTQPGRPQISTTCVENEFLDVRMERLDRLQYLTGELMVLTSSFSNELRQREDHELEEKYMHQFQQLLSAFSDTVLKMRMVPVSRIVPKLKRIVRDICKDQNKDIEFIITGQEMEADKNIVDQLYEAAMHIIRNSADHGIETSKERGESGKPEKGTIKFEVESSGGELVVRISDDGRGMDKEKLLIKARERGLLTKPEEEYTPEEIYEFTMLPGFTTNLEANEYSGRGVGMDIVRKIAEDSGGHVRIKSKAGQGTTVILYLPLTYSIIDSVLVCTGDVFFSIPFRQVCRFLEYSQEDANIRYENGRPVLLYEDKILPIIDLSKSYAIETENEGKVMVYVKGASLEACILVDSIVGQQKVVLKPLPRLLGMGFKNRTGMNGCSIMGDGSICMALDIETFIHFAQKKTAEGRGN